MKSNLKPREKERDLHCANLSCDREEQYKKYFNPLPLPPGKKRGGRGVCGGGGACHCLHSDTTALSDSWNANQMSPEREGGTADAEIKVFQI